MQTSSVKVLVCQVLYQVLHIHYFGETSVVAG